MKSIQDQAEAHRDETIKLLMGKLNSLDRIYFGELLVAAYIAGAASNSPGGAGVWVKASDRFPDEHKNIICKVGELKFIGAIVNDVFYGNGTFYNKTYVEWLDETPLSITPAAIIENVLGVGSPWPLKDVLNKLIEAAGILLDKKNYDGHGWEEIHHCTVIGKQIVEKISGENAASITPSVKDDGKDKRIEELENGVRWTLDHYSLILNSEKYTNDCLDLLEKLLQVK